MTQETLPLSQLTHVLQRERAAGRRRTGTRSPHRGHAHDGSGAGDAPRIALGPEHEYGAPIVHASPTPTAHPSRDAWRPGPPVTR